jgi:sugar lactone lactonase YvrE
MTGGSGGAAGGNSSVTAQFAAHFDPTKGQVPEGLAVLNGVPYVGFAATSEVAKVNLADGTFSTIATLPKPAAGTGFMTGLSFSATNPGVLYVALVSFAPETQPGIYRVAAEGGAVTLFAKDPAMPFPNGLVTDDQGNWFVADSTGIIFRISADGKTVEKWATDDLLVGDKDKSCLAMSAGAGLPFPIGANGIVKNGDSYYVTNTDKGLVARIPVGADGKAGKVVLFAGPDCAMLGGGDGLTVRGTDLVAADNFRNQVVRIDPAGNVTSIVAGDTLDFPASVTFDKDTLYITNFAFLNAQMGKGSPGLMRVDFTNR